MMSGVCNINTRRDEVTLQAIEDKAFKILGVQWHTEKTQDDFVFEIFKTML